MRAIGRLAGFLSLDGAPLNVSLKDSCVHGVKHMVSATVPVQ